jgi:acetylornithine/succinyldiaminopimelate/putrescine aminotransferase
MEQEDVPGRAIARGAYLTEALQTLPGVVNVRGRGLLIAVELEGNVAQAVAAAALNAGLVVNPVTASALRLAPSLLVTEEEIDQAVAILAKAIESVQVTP